MKSSKIRVLVLFLIVFAIPIYGLRASSQSVNQEEIEKILEECANYCEKLNHLVLYFVCREEITERIDHSGPKEIGQLPPAALKRIRKKAQFPVFEKSVYIYDYQLIRRDNKTREKRILLEENGQEKNEQNAPLKTRRFKHIYMVFGPIGLLSKYNQQFYDYRIVEETEFNGEEVFIIEAAPKSYAKPEKLSGKIWIRRSDFCVLKIEWNQTSVGNYKEIEKIASKLNAIPQITLMTEYDFEKNKIRFPSKYSLEEEYMKPEGGRYKKSEIIVLYKDYKFFTVETEVKH
ncbi:MAG: hypothetical protein WBF32_01830 [Candidatus Aminicenantaceae bacterium]